MFDTTVELLQRAGHEVSLFTRDNRSLSTSLHRLQAGLSSFHCPQAVKDLRALLKRDKPDLVHIRNVYPMISPSVISLCHEMQIPVVLGLDDYTLLCPTSHHYRADAVCELCASGHEFQCVLHNCRGDILMSGVYAARTAMARIRRLYYNKISAFTTPTDFVKQKFAAAGFAADRFHTVPNTIHIPATPTQSSQGEYIAYVGRVSPEKGIEVLLEAARSCALPVRVAGDYTAMETAVRRAPANVHFLGPLPRTEIAPFLLKARFAVAPSVCMETFNLSCAEAMAAGIPVIASRIGGMPEVVEEGRHGLLFTPGDARELAGHMTELWSNPELADRLGRQARHKACAEYGAEVYIERLNHLFKHLLQGTGGRI